MDYGHRARPWGSSPANLGYGTQSLNRVCDDVDSHFQRTKRRRQDPGGSSRKTVLASSKIAAEDLDGHRWLIITARSRLSPANGGDEDGSSAEEVRASDFAKAQTLRRSQAI